MHIQCSGTDDACFAGTDPGTTISEVPSTAEIIEMGLAAIAETQYLERSEKQ